LTNLELELERMRICDFSDVNESDKKFFIKWNEIVHEGKSQQGVIGHEEMLGLLKRFAKEGKAAGIRRIHMVMHGWTLWSAGKISADDVAFFLQEYDQ
jgi:hypothetical protein